MFKTASRPPNTHKRFLTTFKQKFISFKSKKENVHLFKKLKHMSKIGAFFCQGKLSNVGRLSKWV